MSIPGLSNMPPEILITGLGMVSPLGDSAPLSWKNLSQSSVGTVPNLEPIRLWGLSPEVRFNGFLRARGLAEQVTKEALTDAGLWNDGALQNIDPERAGCTVSASKPLFDGDTPLPPELINEFVVQHFGLRGESRNVIAACATGAYSIALGASWIEQGFCDVVLAGSIEPYPHPLIEAGFRKMGVMSHEGVTRPFDHRRSGFNLGEGAGMVVLESEAHARHRGVKSYGRLTGWALGSDTHSAVAFNSNGAKIARVINRALKHGGLSAEAVRHVNAHGTATRLNDWIETQALLQAFGPHAKDLMISATKASTGHLLGASGSVEFIFTTLALRDQYIPPTATLEEADPECPLDYTPGKGHTASFDHALSLSFGFGGPIGALVVSR
jgi:3-oxoacyl-[acyl-carrier-protein] synthase II